MTASSFSQITVTAPKGSVAPATQIVDATGLDVLVYNTDTTNTVWLSENNYTSTADVGSNNVTPLGPQESVVFNGKLPVFAVCASGVTVVLNLYPSATNFTPFTQVTSLYSSLTPPAGTTFPLTIAANGSFTPINLVDVSLYQSYDIGLLAIDASQATSGHALAFNVTLTWYDDLVSGVPVFRESWNPWVLQTQGSTPGIIGSGPMHGRYMTIVISNQTGFPFNLNFFNLFGSNRNVQLSDWRQNYGNHVNDHTLTELSTIDTGFENSLCDWEGALAISTGYLLPLHLYSGPASVTIEPITAIPDSINLLDIGTNSSTFTSGNIPTNGNGNLAGDLNFTQISAGGFTQIVDLPRSACAVKVVMNSSSTAGNLAIKVVAQQGP